MNDEDPILQLLEQNNKELRIMRLCLCFLVFAKVLEGLVSIGWNPLR